MAAGTQIQHPDHSWVGYGKGYSGEGWALAFALRRVLVLRSDKIRTKIVGVYDATLRYTTRDATTQFRDAGLRWAPHTQTLQTERHTR